MGADGWRSSRRCDVQLKTAPFYRAKIEYPFFEVPPKGVHGGPMPKAYVFETVQTYGMSLTRGPQCRPRRRRSIFTSTEG